MKKHDICGGKNVFTWQLTASKSVFDLQCGDVMLLDIIEKLDATHQSFTLVFLCFLRGTRGFQPYGDKEDVVIRWNAADRLFFFIQTLILVYIFLPSRGATQVNLCINKALSAFNSSLQVTARSISGALLCWQASECASCATCFSLRQWGGNWSKVLCLSTKYLNSFFCISKLQTSITFAAQTWMNVRVFYAYSTIYLHFYLQIMPGVRRVLLFLHICYLCPFTLVLHVICYFKTKAFYISDLVCVVLCRLMWIQCTSCIFVVIMLIVHRWFIMTILHHVLGINVLLIL